MSMPPRHRSRINDPRRRQVVERRGGGENEDRGKAAPIVKNLPASSLAPQHPARDGVIPTTVLTAPILFRQTRLHWQPRA